MKLTDVTLFHGSAAESVVPTFGLGDDRHDYGRGFYLTDDLSLAKEWAVCRPEESNGWVHAYRLIDIDILEELLMLGGLGMQYCLKSERAFACVEPVTGYPIPVEYASFNAKYNERDRQARDKMDELIAGPRNPAVKVMSTLV